MKSQDQSQANYRFSSIEQIRGVAALSVLFVHLGNTLPENSLTHFAIDQINAIFKTFVWCNGGVHPGVIIFIVLSGYCIHLPQARRKSTSLDYKNYLYRRFFRIYPPYIFAMLVGIAFLYLTNQGFTINLTNLLTNATLAPAIIPASPPINNTILLTVIVECALYAAYLPLFRLLTNSGWTAIGLITVVIYAINMLLFAFDINRIWLPRNFYAFLLFWWIGAYACDITMKYGYHLPKYSTRVIYALYFTTSHLIDFHGAHMFKTPLLAIASAALIIRLCSRETVTSSETRNPLLFFGMISYSLYITHMPMIGILPTPNTFFSYSINVVIILLASLLTYYLIERPSHKFALHPTKN